MAMTRYRTKLYVLALSTVIGIGGYFLIGLNRSGAEGMIDEKRRQVAQQEFDKRPEYFSEESKRNILAQKITVGMTPYEVHLAGGGFVYKVQADPKHWPPGADPMRVIAAQTDQPDDSKITLTFRNTTQFQTREPTTFRVEIRRGRVTEVVPVDK